MFFLSHTYMKQSGHFSNGNFKNKTYLMGLTWLTTVCIPLATHFTTIPSLNKILWTILSTPSGNIRMGFRKNYVHKTSWDKEDSK